MIPPSLAAKLVPCMYLEEDLTGSLNVKDCSLVCAVFFDGLIITSQ